MLKPASDLVAFFRCAVAGATPGWLRFASPREILQARTPAEVPGLLVEIEQAAARGRCAAGYLAYEAAPAFDAAFATHPESPLPLAVFGIYDCAEKIPALPAPDASFAPLVWTPSEPEETYRAAIRRIRRYIETGDTYQVNYTFRLRAPFCGDVYALFRRLCRAEPAPYAALLDFGDHAVASGSPELFFELDGERLLTRPMKGTASRGLFPAADAARAEALRESAKDLAENAMIADMLRNDCGRVAIPGSVRVEAPFAVEGYPTLFQMTTTVAAKTRASVAEIFRALFPCASITGAPKVRTTQIIRELEAEPRGVYTGAVGYVLPGRRARFSVAIRTVHVDRRAKRAEYGVGGGIVWESNARDEYEECRLKATVLTEERPAFSLLETLLWRPGRGYFLLREHLRRLAASAQRLGVPLDAAAVGARLSALAAEFPPERRRVRLLVAETGEITTEAAPMDRQRGKVWRVAFAPEPVDRESLWLYHKTTNRSVYVAARAARNDCDDAILWNRNGEVTESTIANLVARLNGQLLTPPVESGLLPGVLRERLLRHGLVRERILLKEELLQAESIYLVNSVRGWIRASIIG